MVEKKTVKKVAKPVVAKEKEKEVEKKSEAADFSGKYVQAIGRRKTAVAQVRLYEDGKGAMIVNGIKLSKYFPGDTASISIQALKLTSHLRDLNVSIITRGGGKSGQVEAVRHGISHALLKIDENYREALSTAGLLTRDKREVERKKPGLRKARKAPQWSKR
ncbi:MAG: 30S ribosomal protein S9 [Candidatus Falkowbacteria bacterium]